MFRPSRIRELLVVATLFAMTWVARPAALAAQATAADKAAAEALFDEGLSLMRKGHYAEACEKLEQSQAIESGIGTQLYLGECYSKTGRTASAWAIFREAASAAAAQGQKQRSEMATKRAEALKPKLAYLVVEVAAETAALEGLEIQQDERPMPAELLGVAVPVDAGQHVLTAQAPGYQAWSGSITVADGGSVTLAVPALVADATAPAVAVEPAPAPTFNASTAVSTDTDNTREFDRGDTYRLVGWITGGVGVVALGIGTYFGIRAVGKNSDAEAAGCSGQFCNTPEGVSLTSQSLNAASLSNLFVTGGLALMATGVVLHLLAPSATERPANLSVAAGLAPDGSRGDVVLRGAF